MGTPHYGADLGKWAALASSFVGLMRKTNKDIITVHERDSEVLAEINTSFPTMLRVRNEEGKQRIKIMCFHEELPVTGVGLVS